jgi:hypothetical protein
MAFMGGLFEGNGVVPGRPGARYLTHQQGYYPNFFDVTALIDPTPISFLASLAGGAATPTRQIASLGHYTPQMAARGVPQTPAGMAGRGMAPMGRMAAPGLGFGQTMTASRGSGVMAGGIGRDSLGGGGGGGFNRGGGQQGNARQGGSGTAASQGAAIGGRGRRFAEGGMVDGPAGKDKVGAKLTAGEFVLTKEAASHYGDLLPLLNDARAAPVVAKVLREMLGQKQG